MLRSRQVRDDDVRLSELDIVTSEPFGWPGPLRLTSDPALVPTWFGWAAMAAVTAYGGLSAGWSGDARWAAGLLAVAVVFGALAWRFHQEGVWVDGEGVTARDLFSTRRVPWSDVADVVVSGGGRGRSHAWLERTDGRLVLLPNATTSDPPVSDAGVRVDLQILACWWRTGQRGADG